MKKLLIVLLVQFIVLPLFSQKMVLLERKNSAKTTKFYIGDALTYRFNGEKNWNTAQITDILPEQSILKMDQFAIHIDSIGALLRPKHKVVRVTGGALLTFGATLTFASTIALLYNEKDYNYGALYGGAVLSGATGWLLLRPKKVKLKDKHRLRIVEVKFPEVQGQ
jgi:hypothetical protein